MGAAAVLETAAETPPTNTQVSIDIRDVIESSNR